MIVATLMLAAAMLAGPVDATVTRVVDGDTIDVRALILFVLSGVAGLALGIAVGWIIRGLG